MMAKIVDAVASITVDIEGAQGVVLVTKGKSDMYFAVCPGLPSLMLAAPSFEELVGEIPAAAEALVRANREADTGRRSG